MAHITRWAGIGQSLTTTFGNIVSNNSGISSAHLKASQSINDKLQAETWHQYTDMGVGTGVLYHDVTYANQNVEITGYIIWSSGYSSNIVKSPDTFSSYTPATYINLTTSLSEVYSDFSGKINLTATVNGSRSGSNAAVNFKKQGKNAGTSTTNTSYAVEINKLAQEGWGTDKSITYYFSVELDSTAFNAEQPSTVSTVVSNKKLSASTSITVKSAAKDITVGDYSIHINAKDKYETSYFVLAYGNAQRVYDESVSYTLSGNIATVSVNSGKMSITAKDISDSATKFVSANITLKSLCTTKTGGVTNSQPITLYVYDNSVIIVTLNTGDIRTETLVTVEVANERLDKLPTLVPVASLSSTSAITATFANVSEINEVKGSDNKFKYNVTFTGLKAGTQYFYVSNGSYVTVVVSDITLTLS